MVIMAMIFSWLLVSPVLVCKFAMISPPVFRNSSIDHYRLSTGSKKAPIMGAETKIFRSLPKKRYQAGQGSNEPNRTQHK
jgi:hypothetical protein